MKTCKRCKKKLRVVYSFSAKKKEKFLECPCCKSSSVRVPVCDKELEAFETLASFNKI